MVVLICFILSIITSVLVSVLIPISSIYQCWIPLVCLVAGFAVYNILYLTACYIWSLFIDKYKEYDKQNPFIHQRVINALQYCINIARVRVKVNGLEKVPHDQKYLLVFNHTSKYDPIIISYILRQDNVIQITKYENIKTPIAGPFMQRDCFLRINRDNVREAAKTIIKASNFIKNNMYSVSISPEGTRNKTNPKELLPFRDGCFKIGYHAQCPIVVCELHNTFSIFKNALWHSTKVEMNILDCIKYEDYKDLKSVELGEKISKMMQDKIDSHYAK